MASSPSSHATRDVFAWHASIADFAADPSRADRGRAWLQQTERDRFDRYRHDDDRMMFLLGRLMARAMVGRAMGVDPARWRWREGPHGRPEIGEPGTTLRFNLAHSAGLVVCALADGHDVGVDVEDLDRRPVDRGLVDRYCSPSEVADINRQGERWHNRFLVYWTLKEAYLKARGLGISVTLADVSFELGGDDARVAFLHKLETVDPRWLFHLVRPTERHLIAIAADCSDAARPAIVVKPFPMSWADAALT